MTRRILTSEELDVHTGWRRYIAGLRRAGATAAVKRRTRRRERREGNADCQARFVEEQP